MNVNKAIIVGRVTKDPEIKALPSGVSVCSFSLATNRVYKKDDEKVEETDFHNIVSFAGLADTIGKYVKKGQELYIEGRLKTRSWDDKETSKKMYRTEIIAEKMEFGAKAKGSETGGSEPTNTEAPADEPTDEINPEDIPF